MTVSKKKKSSLPYQYTKDVAAIKLSCYSGLMVSPGGTQDRNRMSTTPSAVVPPPNGTLWGDSRWEEHRMRAPDSCGAIKGIISVSPEYCILPCIGKH